MSSVNAFVGHSFSDNDQELVRKFTDFFDTLKTRPLEFDWAHATMARPEEVSKKVLELIEDKNLFIGICTRNERVAKNAAFQSVPLSPWVFASEQKIEWKTSDWIIQEIGLAFGRGMKILLLIEEGVRKPGGLQGDLEYISFSRAHPEKAFQKIIEMISTISPSAALMAAPSEPERSRSASKSDETTEKSLLEDPDPSWELSDFKTQYFISMILKEKDHAQLVSDTYIQSISDANLKGEWQAYCEHTQIIHTDGGDIERIKKIAEEYKTSSFVQACVARTYSHFDDKKKAKEHLRIAIDNSDNLENTLQLLEELGLIAQAEEDENEVFKIVNEMRTLVTTSDNEKQLLKSLSKLNHWYKDDVIKLALLEREIELNPADTSRRFDLAYSYSQENDNQLSLYHYEKIPWSQRNALAWNNLGVAYNSFSLPHKSVAAYKKAVERQETLAMSNLADLLMSAGFTDEAKEQIDKARKELGYDDRVDDSLRRLKLIPQSEDDILKEKLKGSKVKSSFLSHVGENCWKETPKSMPRFMVDEKCKLEVAMKNGAFTANGTYLKESSSNTLANALLDISSPKAPSERTINYTGRLIGRVIIGVRTEGKVGNEPDYSILGAVPITSRFILVLSDDSEKARGMLGQKLTEFEFRD